MRAHLSQTFMFDAAHTLHRQVPLSEFEGSARIHGHTYTAEVTVSGELRDGMIWLPKIKGHKACELDVYFLRRALDEARAKLDHRMLDEVPGLGRPTMENLAAFIGAFVATRGLPVTSVRVSRQTGDSCRVEFA